MIISPIWCQDDYVDFSDMGSYDHGFQANRLSHKTEPKIIEEASRPQAGVTQQGINVENASRPMKFLQRVVKSILRQMNVQSHVFGPGEAITIDLQAEIKYDDYVILNKFINAAEHEEPDKHLNRVDDIMSNLIHVVEHNVSRFDYLEYLLNLPIFCSLKFWLVVITMSVICFLIIMLSLRTVYATNNVAMLFYGFLIIFILSCIWTFSYMYEDARATNYAKLMQTQSPPKDCEYEDLGFKDSVSYFFRVQLFGYKDRCEQYYSTTMTDPFWSVNPLEAISQSFSVLVFAPFGYIGSKVGLFVGGIIHGIPFWLQPLLIFIVFGFLFIGIFGYRIASPLFTIEPAKRQYLEQGSSPVRTQSPAIKDKVKNELVERPERKIMKSVKDASTDMDDFENYINGCQENENYSTPKPTTIHRLFKYLLNMWNLLIHILDLTLRQCPEEPEPQVHENNFVNENNFVDENDFVDANDFINENNDDPPVIPQEIPEEEDVLIPRKRMRHRFQKRPLDHNVFRDVENDEPEVDSEEEKFKNVDNVQDP